MSLKIGVSGVRGIIGESLTEEVISNFAKAFGSFVHRTSYIVHRKRSTKDEVRRTNRAKYILIGRDTRQSGEFVRNVVIDSLLSTGCSIIDLGLAPTPSVLFLTRHLGTDGAIVITASHNPAQWNGLKFVRSDGTFLTKEEFRKLNRIYEHKKFCLPANKKNNNIVKTQDAFKAHLDRIAESLDIKAIRKARFKTALDYCNGTGAVTTAYLLKRLGCEIAAINTSTDGKFAHNPELVAANLGQLCDFVKKTKADIGFAQDPDADRLAVVSEKGIAIGEENTLALAVKHVLAKRGQAAFCYKKDPFCKKQPVPFLRVVVNLSTSRMIDDICREAGARLYRSAVGETNVVDMMRKKRAIIGGEGNGGVIYPAVNFGRDSFVGMALVLEYMAKTGKKVSELVGGIKQYQIEKIKIDCPQEKIASVLKNAKKRVKGQGLRVDTMDGVKIEWPDGWVHMRGSNTEPVIRIMAEAASKEQAQEYIKDIEDVILRSEATKNLK